MKTSRRWSSTSKKHFDSSARKKLQDRSVRLPFWPEVADKIEHPCSLEDCSYQQEGPNELRCCVKLVSWQPHREGWLKSKNKILWKWSAFDISLSCSREGFPDFIGKNIHQENYHSWYPDLEGTNRVKWPWQVVLRIHGKNSGLNAFSDWLEFDLPDEISSPSFVVWEPSRQCPGLSCVTLYKNEILKQDHKGANYVSWRTSSSR